MGVKTKNLNFFLCKIPKAKTHYMATPAYIPPQELLKQLTNHRRMLGRDKRALEEVRDTLQTIRSLGNGNCILFV